MQSLNIGSRRELFIDRYLIERLDRAQLRLQRPLPREVVFQVKSPAENACTACYNLTQEDDRILMYYRGYYPLGESGGDAAESQTAHLAVSADGVRFERPSLGLVDFAGSSDNNIVLRGRAAHNLVVFRDANPAVDPSQLYKAVGNSGTDNLHGFVSADGLHWRPIKEGPLDIPGAFDSVNVPLWDPHTGQYRLFSRYFEAVNGRVRAIQSCASDDFIHWTRPVPHRYSEGAPLEQFYTNATAVVPGAEHILVSFPMRFVPQRTRDTEGMDYPGNGISDAVFLSSRDGEYWDRTFMEAWMRPGLDRRNWTHRNCTTAPGIIATAPDEWSLYMIEHYGWNDNRLRRLTVRPHGFASVSAGWQGGELLTLPLCFAGDRLRLNYSTSAVGYVRLELQDTDGRPLPGFGLEDMEPLFGDELDEVVTWQSGADLGALAGRPVRLRVELQDADLFSLRFAAE